MFLDDLFSHINGHYISDTWCTTALLWLKLSKGPIYLENPSRNLYKHLLWNKPIHHFFRQISFRDVYSDSHFCLSRPWQTQETRFVAQALFPHLRVSQRKMETTMLTITLIDTRRNEYIRRRNDVQDVSERSASPKWIWARHMARVQDER